MTAARTLFKKESKPIVEHGHKKFAFLDELRLMTSCMVAYAYWQAELTAGKIRTLSVETPFNFLVSESLGEFSSGRFDAVVEWNGHLWVRDYKCSTTRKDWFERNLDPNDQAERYIVGLRTKVTDKKIMGVLFEVLWNQDEKKQPEIYVSTSTRTEAQLDSWKNDQEYWLRALDLARQSDQWAMNDKACWNCPYHLVCKSPNSNGQASALRSVAKFNPYDNMKET
jgi:hypothetical protein